LAVGAGVGGLKVAILERERGVTVSRTTIIGAVD